jgi:hypothetical protein
MENTEAFLEASSDVGLEVIVEKTKYMLVNRHQNSGQDYNLLTDNKSF